MGAALSLCRVLCLALLLSVLLASPQVFAMTRGGDTCTQDAFLLTDHTHQVDLSTCLWYLEDASHQLTIKEIRAQEASLDFKKHDRGILNFGYTESAYWVRFDLRYDGKFPERAWLLELMLPLVDEAHLYLYDHQGNPIKEAKSGYALDWRKRDLAVANPVFDIRLPADQPVTAYLRIYSKNTLRMPMHLSSADRYAEKVAMDEIIQGMFLGGMAAIFLYNFFVSFVVRERGYLFYIPYLLFITLFEFVEQVHGQQIFNQVPAFLHKQYLHYYILVAWFWAILTAREVLATKRLAGDLDYVMQLAKYAVIASFFVSMFVDYHVAIEWTVLMSAVVSVLMIVVSYRAWQRHNPAAGIYFFAWFAIAAGVGIYAVTVTGWLPLNALTMHSPQIGVMTQVILLSFALADRIKAVQNEALDWNQRAVASLQRYRSLFDNAIEGIFQISLGRKFIDANPAMANMLGYQNADALLGNAADALSICIDNEQVRHQVIKLLQVQGAVKGLEASYRTREGQQRWANVSMRTVFNDDGTPSHLEGTFVDVTERKQREQVEKERENERVEKELARNSASAKSQFLANMSHEIRTPLAAIIGYGETLIDPEVSEEEKQNSAEVVVRSGRHLLDLVNDILDHSKIDANKLDVELLSVNLPELLDEVRAFFAPRAREKGLEFGIYYDYPLPEFIRTDPTRFRQVLINLCGNALKFTEKGSIKISVRCDRASELVIARIVDTGIGMKPEQMERLFDPFAQASAAIARQYGGTGLGLNISRRLTELLGGRIEVRSTYGEGSEFEASVSTGPLKDVHFIRDASELTQRRRMIPMVHAPRLKGRILCAEDNEVNRRLVDLLVSRTGAEIVHVGNGAEALEKAIREHFDLVLMDIQMPVMNGRDATKAIRDAGINVPIIALTANVMAEDIQDYKEAGCNEHMAKPIDKRRFYEVLASYLTMDDLALTDTAHKFEGTVLVAEDNPDNQKLVERILHRLGVEVLLVDNGSVAVQTALAKTVHMVFMDSHMPGMDGPAATAMLRQTGFRRPIIAFTAGDQEEIDALTAAGCDGVLNKPINQRQLLVLLERFLADNEHAETPELEEDDAIQALVDQFLDGLPDRVKIMQAALEQENWLSLRDQAHQIKGTAGAMGYPLMTEKAGELERALKKEDVPTAKALYPILARMIEQALSARTTKDQTLSMTRDQ